MALGDVERTCEKGGCRDRAAYVGSYTDHLQQARSTAACGQEHLIAVEKQLAGEGFKVTWRLFPARPAATELGGQDAQTQS
jgi:hypothetical protein